MKQYDERIKVKFISFGESSVYKNLDLSDYDLQNDIDLFYKPTSMNKKINLESRTDRRNNIDTNTVYMIIENPKKSSKPMMFVPFSLKPEETKQIAEMLEVENCISHDDLKLFLYESRVEFIDKLMDKTSYSVVVDEDKNFMDILYSERLYWDEDVVQEEVKQEQEIEKQEYKKEESANMESNKIVMTYEGDLAVMTNRGAIAYVGGELLNVGSMTVPCKTVLMETVELLPGDLINKNGKYYGVVTSTPVKLLDIETGTTADIVVEKGVGGITTYQKVVNPLSMSNPIVGMTMLTNGTNPDPVSQMAILNMIQSKQTKVDNTSMIIEMMAKQNAVLEALVNKLTAPAEPKQE